MRAKNWIPWNWFKKEEEDAGRTVPVQRASGPRERGYSLGTPLEDFHREIDRFFERTLGIFNSGHWGFDQPLLGGSMETLLKPTLDLGATDKEYTVSIEIPGVDEKDVQLEIVNDTLTIRGRKNQESEEKGKNFYRLERSYGSFQRVLSLPEDADQDNVKATFKNGVLTVSMPRKALANTDAKQIEVKSAA